MKRVRIKFCGGCNPEYDRLAVAESIKQRLPAAGCCLAGEGSAADVVIVICGCACACADVSEFDHAQVVFVASPAMAGNINRLLASSPGHAGW